MTTSSPERPVVLAAGGAAWESDALREIESSPSMRLARRCVDVAELLAVAPSVATGAAFVAADLPGLDADTVFRLERDGVRVIGLGDAERCRALGIVARAEPGDLHQAVADSGRPPRSEDGIDAPTAATIAVWGPSGAPGRSTLSASLAASFADRGRDTVLVDADTYGGSIAQMLAMLDDVSGLMAACRAANQGHAEAVTDHLLDVAPAGVPGRGRQISPAGVPGRGRQMKGRLRLLSGIARSDMWPQLRPGALELVLQWLSSQTEVVVVDCASSIEPGDGASGGRNQVSRHVLAAADAVLVVGRADPVGLSRLVRAVHDLADLVDVEPVIAINHMRPSLGWSEKDVADTLARLTGVGPVAFVPSDVPALDLAVMRGQLPRVVDPSSSFVTAVDDLAASLEPVVRSTLVT